MTAQYRPVSEQMMEQWNLALDSIPHVLEDKFRTDAPGPIAHPMDNQRLAEFIATQIEVLHKFATQLRDRGAPEQEIVAFERNLAQAEEWAAREGAEAFTPRNVQTVFEDQYGDLHGVELPETIQSRLSLLLSEALMIANRFEGRA